MKDRSIQCPAFKIGVPGCLSSTNQEKSGPGKAVQTPRAATNQRAEQGLHNLTKRVCQPCSLLTRLPPIHTPHPSLAWPSNSKDRRSRISNSNNNLSWPELVKDPNRGAKRQVLQDKWQQGCNFWGLCFKRGTEEGCVLRSGSTDFHLGSPLGQNFAKPGVCNLPIKVLTLGQLTRLISPGRRVLWPQGKLKHIRNILSSQENLFVKVKGDHFAETTDWEGKKLRVVCSPGLCRN